MSSSVNCTTPSSAASTRRTAAAWITLLAAPSTSASISSLCFLGVDPCMGSAAYCMFTTATFSSVTDCSSCSPITGSSAGRSPSSALSPVTGTGPRDRASATWFSLPGLYWMSKSYSCSVRDHLCRRPAGSLAAISHFNAI
ncbi:hypothetical protein PF005_g25762 [Phytophthora fragariae]|uniref:Uncharacterized protein n=1 Tax=Phytophthora fragariae TaxID=53985 RepID=A0A6A3Q753_9STRA|nr:hypothetical protein PF003_g33845 [Phytophthora fragariae]KAE9070293.1 hypothetical protein PF006_g29387 [Phytophthora fragariae]KAE9174662.1 hypothetical protein PF005_g25762 [Phytophthora fragariae]